MQNTDNKRGRREKRKLPSTHKKRLISVLPVGKERRGEPMSKLNFEVCIPLYCIDQYVIPCVENTLYTP